MYYVSIILHNAPQTKEIMLFYIMYQKVKRAFLKISPRYF